MYVWSKKEMDVDSKLLSTIVGSDKSLMSNYAFAWFDCFWDFLCNLVGEEFIIKFGSRMIINSNNCVVLNFLLNFTFKLILQWNLKHKSHNFKINFIQN